MDMDQTQQLGKIAPLPGPALPCNMLHDKTVPRLHGIWRVSCSPRVIPDPPLSVRFPKRYIPSICACVEMHICGCTSIFSPPLAFPCVSQRGGCPWTEGPGRGSSRYQLADDVNHQGSPAKRSALSLGVFAMNSRVECVPLVVTRHIIKTNIQRVNKIVTPHTLTHLSAMVLGCLGQSPMKNNTFFLEKSRCCTSHLSSPLAVCFVCIMAAWRESIGWDPV